MAGVELLTFLEEKLQWEIGQGKFILGGSVLSISEILRNCSTNKAFDESLFALTYKLLDLLLDSSIPWEEIDSEARATTFLNYLQFTKELAAGQRASVPESSVYFQGKNVIAELFTVTPGSNATFEFPSECIQDRPKSRAFVEAQSSDGEVLAKMFASVPATGAIWSLPGDLDLDFEVFQIEIEGRESNPDPQDNNVTLELWVPSGKNLSLSNVDCLAWNDEQSRFSTDGCLVVSTSDDVIICRCFGSGIFTAGVANSLTLDWTKNGVFYLNFVFLAISILVLVVCIGCIIRKKRQANLYCIRVSLTDNFY